MKVIVIDEEIALFEDLEAKLEQIPEISEINFFHTEENALKWFEKKVEKDKDKRIKVRCFGNFEVFADEEPMKFRYGKSKELLAYLIDRNGALCDINTLCAVLWEEKEDSLGLKSMLRHLIADLHAALTSYDGEDILVKHRGSVAILADKVECDYYEWLKGNELVESPYQGEYMSQYSWAETTAGNLTFY